MLFPCLDGIVPESVCQSSQSVLPALRDTRPLSPIISSYLNREDIKLAPVLYSVSDNDFD